MGGSPPSHYRGQLMKALASVKLPYVLKSRIIVREGRFNGILYPAEELRPLVDILNNIPREIGKAKAAGDEELAVRLMNSTSLFWDHDEGCKYWLGDVRNFRWDEKLKGIRGDLYFVDRDAAIKVDYQEKRGWPSWGLSPSFMVDKYRNTASNIFPNNISVVLDPAGGLITMLSRGEISFSVPRATFRNEGGEPMAKKKKKEDLSEATEEEKKDETSEGDEKKDETTDDTSTEDTETKEEETNDSEDKSEEDLSEVEFENEENSDSDEEELQVSLADLAEMIKQLAKIIAEGFASLKKGKGRYPYKKSAEGETEEQSKEPTPLDAVPEKELLEIASNISKEVRALEGKELNEKVLRECLGRIFSLAPLSEELSTDGESEGEEKKEEETQDKAEDKETDSAGEEKAEEEKKDEKTEESEDAKDEDKSDKGTKQEMARLIKEEFAILRGKIQKLENKIAKQVKPKRKGLVEREDLSVAETITRKREALQAQMKDEPSADKRLDMLIDSYFGK